MNPTRDELEQFFHDQGVTFTSDDGKTTLQIGPVLRDPDDEAARTVAELERGIHADRDGSEEPRRYAQGGRIEPGTISTVPRFSDFCPASVVPAHLMGRDGGPAPDGPGIIFAHLIAESDHHDDPFRSLAETIAFSSADWGAARDLAWVYGIVLGWDGDDPDDDEGGDAMGCLAERFGWSVETVARLRRLHEAFLTAQDRAGQPEATPGQSGTSRGSVARESGVARLERYARAVWETSRADEGTISAIGANVVAHAVMAVADAEQEALRAELENCRHDFGVIADNAALWWRRADAAEAERDRLAATVERVRAATDPRARTYAWMQYLGYTLDDITEAEQWKMPVDSEEDDPRPEIVRHLDEAAEFARECGAVIDATLDADAPEASDGSDR